MSRRTPAEPVRVDVRIVMAPATPEDTGIRVVAMPTSSSQRSARRSASGSVRASRKRLSSALGSPRMTPHRYPRRYSLVCGGGGANRPVPTSRCAVLSRGRSSPVTYFQPRPVRNR